MNLGQTVHFGREEPQAEEGCATPERGIGGTVTLSEIGENDWKNR